MMVQGVVAKNLMVMLDLGQPKVVLDEGLKDIHRQLYRREL
jgi:hypothetical protein